MPKLPIAKRVYAKPFFQDEIEEVKKRLKIDNRDSKIEAIIEDKEFIEQKLEDDAEYKKLTHIEVKPLPPPSMNNFFIDWELSGGYKYD